MRTPATRPPSTSGLAAGISGTTITPFSSAMPAIHAARLPSESRTLPRLSSIGGTSGRRAWPPDHMKYTSSAVTSLEIGQPRAR